MFAFKALTVQLFPIEVSRAAPAGKWELPVGNIQTQNASTKETFYKNGAKITNTVPRHIWSALIKKTRSMLSPEVTKQTIHLIQNLLGNSQI